MKRDIVFFLSLLLTISFMAAELKFEVKKLHKDNNEACAIADFNNDGILDVSAGEYWYAGPDYKQRKLRVLTGFGKDYLHNCGEYAYDVYGFTLNCEDIYLGTYRTEAHARIVVDQIRNQDMTVLL